MNKDVKGLIKYLLIIIITWILPIAAFYCGLFAYGLGDSGKEYLARIFLLIGLVLLILYLVQPVIITYKAMKQHWSKYLDIFFTNKILTTIILVILIGLKLVLPTLTYEWILFYVLPYYSVIYLTIMIVHVINWYKNK